ncbi:hypothetical protein Pan216_29240 [Planctomycetes bacterium Pan216]|uniref:Uncharacterized protein n=1 Tax=Kolteria novifilia TaxID=2527975 RepID=A0A518B504_9BACT|nr:hypothetical protein Pan216_29240 [Planctomycetes bacterium Pan216]
MSRSSSEGGLPFGLRPFWIFLVMTGMATGLLWISPSTVKPLRRGVEQALAPGSEVVRWASVKAYRLYRQASRSVPSTQTATLQESTSGRHR